MREGWKKVRLAEVATFKGGGTPSKNKPAYWGGKILWVSPKDMKSTYISTSIDTVTEDGVSNSAISIIPECALLLVVRSGILARTVPICIASSELTVNQDVKAIIPSRHISFSFLYYFLISQESLLLEKVTRGATVHRLQTEVLKELRIPLPDPDEQKRIVAILDEAFEGIDTVIANTKNNLANSRELFESYLNSVFSQRGDGWKRTTLGDEINLRTGFAFKSGGYTADEDGIPLLRGDNIVQGSLRWESHKKWPVDKASGYSDYFLQEGDVVLAMDRTWVKAGIKYAYISAEDLPCLLVQRVARLRSGVNMHAIFLKHLIGSQSFKSYVLSIQTGLGVPHISGKQIADFGFYLPKLSHQADISCAIEDLYAGVVNLEAIYQQKLTALAELKQSLLHKAFSGELTATKAEAAVEEVTV